MATKKQINKQRAQAKEDAKIALRFLGYVVACVIINGLFILALNSSKPIKANAVNQTVVTIDAVESNRIYHQPYYWITADNVEYYFDMTAIWYSGFSMGDSFWCLEEGKELTILYIDRKANTETYSVVEAYDDERIYCSLKGYNKSRLESFFLYIGLYFICTCIFSFVMITSEGWFMQWIRQRKTAIEANKQSLSI